MEVLGCCGTWWEGESCHGIAHDVICGGGRRSGGGGGPCEGTHSRGEQSRAVEVLWGTKVGLGGRRGVGSGQRERKKNQ